MPKSSFGFAKPEESPGFLLWQTTITWQRLIKNVLDRYHLSHAQFVILALLLWFEETQQECIQSDIVSKSKLDKMTVSKALKKLVSIGLVERSEHAQDTRAKLVCLTHKGRTLTRKLIPFIENIDHQFFSIIRKNDQRLLLQFLQDLVSGKQQ